MLPVPLQDKPLDETQHDRAASEPPPAAAAAQRMGSAFQRAAPKKVGSVSRPPLSIPLSMPLPFFLAGLDPSQAIFMGHFCGKCEDSRDPHTGEEWGRLKRSKMRDGSTTRSTGGTAAILHPEVDRTVTLRPRADIFPIRSHHRAFFWESLFSFFSPQICCATLAFLG